MSGQNESPYYFVPHPSRHPISASIGLLVMLSSLAAWVNGESWAPITAAAGLLWLLFTLCTGSATPLPSPKAECTASASTARTAGA